MKNTFLIKFIAFILLSTAVTASLYFILCEHNKNHLTGNVSTTTSLNRQFKTVVIDAGHGGEDGGTSSADGLIEKDINLEISQILRDMLIANGINVVMTRNDDRLLYDRNVDYKGRKKVLDLAARLNISEQTPNSIFVSIHMNAFSSPKFSGLQVWYSGNNPLSYELAHLIQSNTKNTLQPDNNRKVKLASSSIFLLDKAKSPSVLIECGFLSNVDEAKKLESFEYRKQVAFVIYSSIVEFLNCQDNY